MFTRFFLAALLLAAPALAAAPARPPTRTAAAKAAAAKPAAAIDWASRIAATPAGGLLIGNPAARVKLVEFGSLTCPHCRHFHETGLPVVKSRFIAAGTVSYEYRPFTLNGIDLMAGHLLYCQAPAAAWAFVNKAYARQDQLVAPFMQISAADRTAVEALPADQQGARMAILGKLPEFSGLAPARYQACIAARPAMDRLLAIRADAVQAHGLTGTPSFLINGKMQTDVFDWPALEPLLAAAVQATQAPGRMN
ncbi:MAG: thioredoxin domain-containing protein [Alphaproteobacteria bacterium]|nr:thioredoxin domain-containing protein [Alphaproteobacteria bacterium]